MSRVIVTRPMIGICHMQVCAAKDATDEEILEVSNRENLCGTSQGWCSVHRGEGEDAAPVVCEDDPSRLHIIVGC